jgi:hypothetical protein
MVQGAYSRLQPIVSDGNFASITFFVIDDADLPKNPAP